MQRRGFTLLELLVAGVMASVVLGSVTICLSQLGLSKSISRQRLDAYSRCDTALRTIRRDIISVLRRDDLFDTRLRIIDNSSNFEGRVVNRDELLLFNSSLRANKEIDFNGEGTEYETQFRIDDDGYDIVMWKRRDPILDDNPLGGGIATPLAKGIVSLQLEAYDGETWVPQWDSDELGIPHAIRITIIAIGSVVGDDLHPPLIELRTVVPLDRIMAPADLFEDTEEEEAPGSDDELGLGNEDGDGAAPSIPGGIPIRGDSDAGTSSGGNSKGDTFIFTDPDGNKHEIPMP
jgi:type II secretion system protein J